MRFLFIVQGEGRGHLTQALALSELIREAGHTVCTALLGSADGETVQAFFKENFTGETIPFASPVLVYHPQTKALSLPKTLGGVGRGFHRYCAGLIKVRRVVKEQAPDLVVNFYDVLGGLHSVFSSVPTLCVAHQYLLLHPHFKHPSGQRLSRFLVNLNTRITALGAARSLALSFYREETYGKLKVIPPLLRKEVQELQSQREDFYLAYVTQAAMAGELLAWQAQHPEVELHCFSAGEQAGEVQPNFYFHPIHARKFLDRMRRCRGLMTTAGFESVAEALLLGKPVLAVPLPRHYEQTCNALDAQRAGAGIYSRSLEADALLAWEAPARSTEFRAWVEQAGELFFQVVGEVMQERRRPKIDLPVLWRAVEGT